MSPPRQPGRVWAILQRHAWQRQCNAIQRVLRSQQRGTQRQSAHTALLAAWCQGAGSAMPGGENNGLRTCDLLPHPALTTYVIAGVSGSGKRWVCMRPVRVHAYLQRHFFYACLGLGPLPARIECRNP